jgi:hypothetical protein
MSPSDHDSGWTTPEAMVWIVAITLVLGATVTAGRPAVRAVGRLLTIPAETVDVLRAERLVRRTAAELEVPFWIPAPSDGAELLSYHPDATADGGILVDGSAGYLTVGGVQYPVPRGAYSDGLSDVEGWPSWNVTILTENSSEVRVFARLGSKPNALW